MKPDDEPDTAPDALAPAVEWIRERGGCKACARDVLLKSLSVEPGKIRAALDRVGAPAGTFALLGVELYQQGKELADRLAVDEGPEDWWHR